MNSPDIAAAVQPQFTVVMATKDRGRHILPSIRSVLAQDLDDFELLVIGDACTDDTGTIVQGLDDSRLRWINLDEGWGTQSGPNNRGNEEARADIIAYIGHDDIWTSDHLSSLASVYAETGADVVAGGVLFHPQPSEAPLMLLGIGDETYLKTNFIPPTGLSHRRKVWSTVGGWRRRSDAQGPVDSDFAMRAIGAGFRFASTGKVSAHKFTASARYLSYLIPTSDEQEAALAILQCDAAACQRWRDALLARVAHTELSLAERSRPETTSDMNSASDRNRGIELPPLVPLAGEMTLEQTRDHRVGQWLPWSPNAPRRRWSCSGVNPHLLVPVTSDGAATVSFRLWSARRGFLFGLRLESGGQPLKFRARRRWKAGLAAWHVTTTVKLKPDAPTVITFYPPRRLQTPRRGIAIGALTLSPA